MMAYSGPCHVRRCLAPVVEQTRYFKIEGDMLSIITAPGQHPTYPGRTVRGVLTWKRE
jgi:hypothetical protein